MSVLIIDSNDDEARGLRDALQTKGWRVEAESDTQRGLHRCRNGEVDLALVDVRHADADSLAFVRALRSEHNLMPLIALGDGSQETLSCEILHAGADDFVHRPAPVAFLIARMEALLRRVNGFFKPAETSLSFADIHLDLLERRTLRGGRQINLKPREFKLLEYLIRNAERIITREELLKYVWGIAFDPQTNVVEVHVSRLRARLDRDFDRQLLRTVRAKGYILSAALAKSGGRESRLD